MGKRETTKSELRKTTFASIGIVADNDSRHLGGFFSDSVLYHNP